MTVLAIPLQPRLHHVMVVCAPRGPGALAPKPLPLPPGLRRILEAHRAPVDVRLLARGDLEGWLAARLRGLGPRHDVLSVVTEDLNARPHSGLWTVIHTALTLAQGLGGTACDPVADRDLCFGPGELPADGAITAARHVVVAVSLSAPDRLWMTTIGMRKFGLPDLEVRSLPARARWFALVLNGVAQTLIERAADAVASDPQRSELRLPSSLTVDPAILQRANVVSDRAPFEILVEVGLSFKPGRFPNGLIRVGPPASGGDADRWISSVGERLLPFPAPSRN